MFGRIDSDLELVLANGDALDILHKFEDIESQGKDLVKVKMN